MSTLALFDARPKCARCGRAYDSPTWEARADDGAIIRVCSACAHLYIGRARQVPTKEK